MLTNLTLENFKAFQKLDDLKIKPITILCGANSCGKSSILQSILLLKQTLNGISSNQTLRLNGELIKLGAFKDVVFRKTANNSIKLALKFLFDDAIMNQNIGGRPLFYPLLTGVENKQGSSEEKNSYLFEYDISIKNVKDAKKQEDTSFVLVENIQIKLSSINLDKADLNMFFSANHLYHNIYSITSNINDKASVNNLQMGMLFPSLHPIFFESSSGREIFQQNSPYLQRAFFSFNEILRTIFYSYSYIGPLRGGPERHYFVHEDETTKIGNMGENAAYLYFVEQNKKIGRHYFLNAQKNNFEELLEPTLKYALNKWFELMKIPSIEARNDNKIISLNLEASMLDETRVNIADAGFGISQIFPIILEGLRMEKGSTLILEQPEIHLHPNLQMQMADYFISLALSGKQVLVETHSDHVINRLVRRIVEDETHNLQDLIGIYFIKPSENGSIYEEVKIDETKGIVNWPPDFFDQTANEQMKIMQAGLKKRKNQRVAANGKNS